MRAIVQRVIAMLQQPETTLTHDERDILAAQMRSPHRDVAEQALQHVIESGMLSSGMLHGADLRGVSFYRAELSHANLRQARLNEARLAGCNLYAAMLREADLSGANLTGSVLYNVDMREANLTAALLLDADLRGADLRNATLEGTKLGNADLYGAYLSDGQLLQASVLCGATMPGGERYDGRYNLPGDLELAAFLGIELDDHTAMAEFYSVPTSVYNGGQVWSSQYLAQVQSDLRGSHNVA